MNLVLIGYRGTGKSTIARELAARLEWVWVDADVELEARAGKSIAAIFADEGEKPFRDLESQVIADLVQRNQTIVAAGGGVILREENRAAIRSHSKVVWLTATVENIVRRVNADQSTAGRRPNLTTQGGEAEIRQLLSVREPLYREMADWIVATDGKSPGEIAEEIERCVKF